MTGLDGSTVIGMIALIACVGWLANAAGNYLTRGR